MHFSTTIGSFVSGTVLDAGATKVSKIRHPLSKSSHHLIGGQDRHSQLTVIIARTEVATRTNSLRQEPSKGWWNLSTNLLLFCFLILCGRNVKGSTCPLTLARLHMQSSSFSFMRLQPQSYRFKGTGLGRPLWLSGLGRGGQHNLSEKNPRIFGFWAFGRWCYSWYFFFSFPSSPCVYSFLGREHRK